MKKYLPLALLVLAATLIAACGTHHPPIFDAARTSIVFSFDAPASTVMK